MKNTFKKALSVQLQQISARCFQGDILLHLKQTNIFHPTAQLMLQPAVIPKERGL